MDLTPTARKRLHEDGIAPRNDDIIAGVDLCTNCLKTSQTELWTNLHRPSVPPPTPLVKFVCVLDYPGRLDRKESKFTAFEGFGIGECTGYQSSSRKVYWNDIPVFIFCVINIESPKNASNIDKQALLGDMQPGTDPEFSTKSEMIPFKDVGMRGVLC